VAEGVKYDGEWGEGRAAHRRPQGDQQLASHLSHAVPSPRLNSDEADLRC